MIDPPEPRCPRCKQYIDEDDSYHCPLCMTDLISNYIVEGEKYFCMEHEHLETFHIHELVWRCHHCGFDARPRECDICGKELTPSEHDLCQGCRQREEEAEFLASGELDYDPDWDIGDEFD